MNRAPALLSAFVALLLPSVAEAQVAEAPAGVASMPVILHEDLLGGVTCGSKPYGWVRTDVLLSDEGSQLVAHEEDHRAVALAFPSCAAFQEWSKRPGNRLKMEARAYCVSARVDTATGRLTWEKALQMHGARLAYGYPFGLSEEEAQAEILKACDTLLPEAGALSPAGA